MPWAQVRMCTRMGICMNLEHLGERVVISQALDPTTGPWGRARQQGPLGVGSGAQLDRAAARPRATWPTVWHSWASPQPGFPRATSNARVRETVALELSYVNSSLQLLKEELEGLSCSVDADGPARCARARTRTGPGGCPRVCMQEGAIGDRRCV